MVNILAEAEQKMRKKFVVFRNASGVLLAIYSKICDNSSVRNARKIGVIFG